MKGYKIKCFACIGYELSLLTVFKYKNNLTNQLYISMNENVCNHLIASFEFYE